MNSINPMQIMAAPEMMRTNPMHAGNAPLSVSGTQNFSEKNSVRQGSFESYLIDAVDKVNSHQLGVADVTQQLITDPDSVDVHDVTTAMAKAQMSLSLAQTVIDRLLTGWSEIQTTR